MQGYIDKNILLEVNKNHFLVTQKVKHFPKITDIENLKDLVNNIYNYKGHYSVKNALKHIPDNAIVAIHDGVRPFVDAEFLEYMFGCGIEHGAAIPVIPPSDSMRITYGEAGSEIVDRSIYVMVQTPQVFHSEILKEAYKQAFSPEFTDDASVVETIKQKIYLAEGRFMNIKITRPDDLVLGEGILNAVSSKSRF